VDRQLVRGRLATVTLLIVGYSGYYLCRSNLSVCMPLLIADLARRGMSAGAARISLGSMASVGVLAYALGKFPSGSLADLFGGRRNFLTGMAGAVLFTLFFAGSGSLPLFTIAWIGNRLVQSLGWAGAVTMASRWFPFRQYGTVMAFISLSYLFGDALARQFMAVLIGRGFGWRAVFAADALVLTGLCVACLVWLREPPPALEDTLEPAVSPTNLFPDDSRQDARTFSALMRPFLKSRVFQVACVLSLGTTILRETFNLWTPTYFTQAAGMTPAEAAAGSAWFSFVGGVSVIVCGLLSDRLGRGGRAALMCAGLLLATLALALLASGSTFHGRTGPVLLVAAVAFVTIGPYSFLAGAVALDFGGKKGSGTASGLIDGVGYLGGVLSGDSMARISVAFGWSGAFAVLAAVAALSTIVAGVFYRYERWGALRQAGGS
jgi:sugar phosphate permease